MNNGDIFSRVNGYIYSATKELCLWLKQMLPRTSEDWWQDCVISNLSYAQKTLAENNSYTRLEQFDLAALLRIADKSWYDMRSFAYLPSSARQYVRSMMRVRNNWAHFSGSTFEKDMVLQDIEIILGFLEEVIKTSQYSSSLKTFKLDIEHTEFTAFNGDSVNKGTTDLSTVPSGKEEIAVLDTVSLVSNPDIKGLVISVSKLERTLKYQVFINGEQRIYYDGQITKNSPDSSINWVNLNVLTSNLTAYEINNPSVGNLYSLNAARIDFVPYQFRPALKLIKADEPRILIADSVGVGKTIEAGIIIKELDARKELNNVLIICPKPLVAERKWELEMKRFDEDFTPLDGPTLRQCISDSHRDAEWPAHYNRAIIPYSILDEVTYRGKNNRYGLLDLDQAPHFDLIIIDEAHYLRNGSLEKEKAYAYKCVHFFCEHADAVVMLTATPLQTKDDDLYTILNLMRPDVVMDKEVFQMMSRPNEYISNASHIVRCAAEKWQTEATDTLLAITKTQWGENIVAKNPLYRDILGRLQETSITRDERVKLITDIESLHSFHQMINRTRRRDIQDFCVRRPYTIETRFTKEQETLHNAVLQFEQYALISLHGVKNVQFMMATIKRQAASCIYGLAPYIKDIVSRRIDCMAEIAGEEEKEVKLDDAQATSLSGMAQRVIKLAENLPECDPKFNSLLDIINEKQEQENNKIILFSTFRHTLNYIKNKLDAFRFRVAQIDGSVSDEDRRTLRARFAREKSQPDALDILLFTEVGSEGLDYQFCDTMINYDLPWNPMKVEQRIGRIDRRGQKSEAVHIYNLITADTVDADIYNRCLERVGVFERSIGECEEILGEIASQIEKIAMASALNPEERRLKLEQMADNEIRRMQELTRLEEEQKTLFGFALGDYTARKQIRESESPWLTPQNILLLVKRYLNERIGEGNYMKGDKQLCIAADGRLKLLEDFRKLTDIKSGIKHKWESYLKGITPYLAITFYAESAVDEPKAHFLTPTHPLVKQAAHFFSQSSLSHIYLECSSNIAPAGEYPFAIYTWNYIGNRPSFKVVPICENSALCQILC